MSLEGKTAIVTGGAGNVGSATALLLASRGARVVVADLNLGRAQAVANQISAQGYVAAALRFDLGDEAEIRCLIETTVTMYGRLDILSNNAADLSSDSFSRDGNIETMDVKVWDRTFALNVRGTMLCCKYALAAMPHEMGASIINTASNLALQGHLVQAAYSSSKAALIQMTRAIAASHGRFGIRCNTVSPGLLLTPDTVSAIPAALRRCVEEETLTGRLGEVSDIASVVAFLASDEATHITGQNIVVDGGNTSHIPGIAQLSTVFSV